LSKRVLVRSYERKRNGKIETVERHSRRSPQRIDSNHINFIEQNQERKKKALERDILIEKLKKAINQLDEAEKERRLNPAQQKRRRELKRMMRDITDKMEKEKWQKRHNRKQRYKSNIEKLEKAIYKKKKQDEYKELTTLIATKKEGLPKLEKAYRNSEEKMRKLAESVSEEANKEFREKRWSYKQYGFEGWEHPEEADLLISLRETEGELYKEHRKHYEAYWNRKGSIEALEKKAERLKKAGFEKEKLSIWSNKTDAQLLQEINQLQKNIPAYKRSKMSDDYIREKEKRLKEVAYEYDRRISTIKN